MGNNIQNKYHRSFNLNVFLFNTNVFTDILSAIFTFKRLNDPV